jgi:hypothetical protein
MPIENGWFARFSGPPRAPATSSAPARLSSVWVVNSAVSNVTIDPICAGSAEVAWA